MTVEKGSLFGDIRDGRAQWAAETAVVHNGRRTTPRRCGYRLPIRQPSPSWMYNRLCDWLWSTQTRRPESQLGRPESGRSLTLLQAERAASLASRSCWILIRTMRTSDSVEENCIVQAEISQVGPGARDA